MREFPLFCCVAVIVFFMAFVLGMGTYLIFREEPQWLRVATAAFMGLLSYFNGHVWFRYFGFGRRGCNA